MSPKLRTALIVIGAVILIIVTIILVPRGLSIYYQAKGGQQIEYVLRFEEGIDEMLCEQLPSSSIEALEEVEWAIVNLNRAIRFNRNNSQAYYYLGKAHCLQGEPVEAVEDYLQYTILRPDNPLGYLVGGFAREGTNLEDSATRLFEKASITQYELIQVGDQLRSEERCGEAVNWYQRAILLDDQVGDVYYLMGQCYQKIGDWEMAEQSYFDSLASDYLYLIGVSDIHYRIGNLYKISSELQDFDKALQFFSSAIDKDDFLEVEFKAESYYKVGEIYNLLNEDPIAPITNFRKAISINPDHLWAHLRLGQSIYEKYGDVQLAEYYINKAIRSWPKNKSKKYPHIFLGDIYIQEGEFEKAIIAYNKAIELDPEDLEISEKAKTLGQDLQDG